MAAVLPVPQPLVYSLVLSLFPLFWIASRFGWRPAAISLALLAAPVHGLEDLLQVWRAEQLQLLFSASAVGALLLGASSERVATQSKALMLGLEQLHRRSTELVDIARRLTSVQEEERRNLGGELHDVLGQDLTSIATRLRVVERTNDDPALRAGLQSISQLVTQAHQHLREVTEYAYPAVLDRFGLQRALCEGPLMQLARDAGMDYRCEVHGDLGVLHDEAATSLYRICQEATSNCVREPSCNLVHIVFETLLAIGDAPPPESRLIMSIHDDAGSIAPAAGRTGMGLQNIRDRANALGAQYRFNPQHGGPRHCQPDPGAAPGVEPGSWRVSHPCRSSVLDCPWRESILVESSCRALGPIPSCRVDLLDCLSSRVRLAKSSRASSATKMEIGRGKSSPPVESSLLDCLRRRVRLHAQSSRASSALQSQGPSSRTSLTHRNKFRIRLHVPAWPADIHPRAGTARWSACPVPRSCVAAFPRQAPATRSPPWCWTGRRCSHCLATWTSCASNGNGWQSRARSCTTPGW